MAKGKDQPKDINSGRDLKVAHKDDRASDPMVQEFRNASLEAREADMRLAAAAARVASTTAMSDEEYESVSRAISANARIAVETAKLEDDELGHHENSIASAKEEYSIAINAKKSADKRVKEAEQALQHDIELAALAYILSKEDSIEKEIAMALLEENELKIISHKYNLDSSFIRNRYKKEKLSVQIAEEEALEIKEEKEVVEVELEEAEKKANKLANYLAEFEDFNSLGLADKNYKNMASRAKSEIKNATLEKLEAERELEVLNRKLSAEEKELEEVIESSEFYREVQERLQEPLKQAAIERNKGNKLPSRYEETLHSAAEVAAVNSAIIKAKKVELRNYLRDMEIDKKWGVIKILLGLSCASSAAYFTYVNPVYYMQFALPCCIAGLSLVGFGLKDWEKTAEAINDKNSMIGHFEDDGINQSLTTSLSKSLIESLTNPNTEKRSNAGN
jgi:hypothetical protein